MINRKPSRFGTNIQLRPETNDHVKVMKNSMTAFAGVLLFIGVIFTVRPLLLALLVSHWWFIAVAICAAYTIITAAWVGVMRKLMNSVPTF